MTPMTAAEALKEMRRWGGVSDGRWREWAVVIEVELKAKDAEIERLKIKLRSQFHPGSECGDLGCVPLEARMSDKGIAERLKALESEYEPDCGEPGCDDCASLRRLASIRVEIEAVAHDLTHTGCPWGKWAGELADRLAREGEK